VSGSQLNEFAVKSWWIPFCKSGHAHSFTVHSNFKIGNYLETSPSALLRSVSSMKPITVNKLHVNYIITSQKKPLHLIEIQG